MNCLSWQVEQGEIFQQQFATDFTYATLQTFSFLNPTAIEEDEFGIRR